LKEDLAEDPESEKSKEYLAIHYDIAVAVVAITRLMRA